MYNVYEEMHFHGEEWEILLHHLLFYVSLFWKLYDSILLGISFLINVLDSFLRNCIY